MTDLTITPDLVRDLHDRSGGAAPDRYGIVLTSGGWQIDSWDNRPEWPVAFTAEATDAYSDEDGVLDDDAAEALSTPEQHLSASYDVWSEYGDDRRPPAGGEVTVVTGDWGHEALYESWTEAWWFDAATATELVCDSTAELNTGRTSSLWRTAGGRYVACTRSIRAGEADRSWSEVTRDAAAEWAYHADADRVAENLPPLLAAARHLRAAQDAITVPRAPNPSGEPEYARYDLIEEAAIEAVHDARALTELARGTAGSGLRAKRARAARLVTLAAGSEQAAADALNISRKTLTDLVADEQSYIDGYPI